MNDELNPEQTPSPAPLPMNGEREPMEDSYPADSAPAFMAPVDVTPELAAVIGEGRMSRSDITKKLWDYIKKNGLQDKKNKRNIHADNLLRPIFGKDLISMFEMATAVSRHVIKPGDSAQRPSRPKARGSKQPAKKSGAPTAGAAAKQAAKPGKSPSLLNATQSALLYKRLEKVKEAKLRGVDVDEVHREQNNESPMAQVLADAVLSGRLQLKQGAELAHAVADIFREGDAEFAMVGRVKHGIQLDNAWEVDFVHLLADPSEFRILEKEFDLQTKAQEVNADAVRKGVVKVAGRISRAIASGTHTGAEVTAMLDEFEQMTFDGGE